MKIIIIGLLFCFVAVYTFGQEFCMYSQKQKVCYEISETKFILRSETLDVNDIKNTLQNFGNLKEIVDMIFGTYLVEMQNTDKKNLQELRRQLGSSEKIIYTSPVFVDESGLEDSYTNEILVRLNSKDDYYILQKSAETYSIKDIKLYKYDDRTYTLTLPHNPEKDAAEVSLELFETGLFEFAHPNILILWPFGNPDSNMNIPARTVAFYPNPVRDILYIDLEKSVSAQVSYDIRLYNSQGKMFRQTKAAGGIVQFSVSNLPVGIYFLNIYSGASITPETFKILIEH